MNVLCRFFVVAGVVLVGCIAVAAQQPSVTRPVRTHRNPIAHRGQGVFGPGHHCVVNGPDGRLWMVYHQQNSEKTGWQRFLAIDPLWFDEQGVIHFKTTRGTDEPAP